MVYLNVLTSSDQLLLTQDIFYFLTKQAIDHSKPSPSERVYCINIPCALTYLGWPLWRYATLPILECLPSAKLFSLKGVSLAYP
jgi:hypothetical protein